MADRLQTSRRRPRYRAAVVVGVFLAMVIVPGGFQLIYGTGWRDWVRWRDIARQQPVADSPRLIEEDVNQRFLAARAARTLMLGVPVAAFRPKLGGYIVGREGWLYNDVDVAVTRSAGFLNPHFPRAIHAVDAIGDMADQLRARGIHLLVIPVPAKASIYPEFLERASGNAAGPLLNVQHAEWFAKLRERGVDTIDLTDLLWREKVNGPVYFEQESHWSQWAMRNAAPTIARRLRQAVPDLPPPATFEYRWIPHVRPGDIRSMDEASGSPDIPVKEQFLQLRRGDEPLVPGNDAPVLLIGDSFAALFNDEGTSLAAVLTREFGVEVQSVALVGGRGDTMRSQILRHPGILKNKRAVVMVFTLRLLICCEWNKLPVED